MFFKKCNIGILPILLLVFVASCSPYQKVLKSDDVALKFAMADSLYQEGKFKKSLKLMEDIVPAYRGKPQAERLMFFYADTYYQLGDYYLSGYQFERFVRSYPLSEKVPEAAFKGAKSYYELSPRYTLDQVDTYTALEKLQGYIDRYPESELIGEANELVAELNSKLEEKAIEIAKQYYHRDDYKSAIEAFENFITDFPGSSFRKEAFYFRFDSSYQLAINSFTSLVPERLEEAREHYDSFNKYFAESDRKEDADKILQDIDKRLNVAKTQS